MSLQSKMKPSSGYSVSVVFARRDFRSQFVFDEYERIFLRLAYIVPTLHTSSTYMLGGLLCSEKTLKNLWYHCWLSDVVGYWASDFFFFLIGPSFMTLLSLAHRHNLFHVIPLIFIWVCLHLSVVLLLMISVQFHFPKHLANKCHCGYPLDGENPVCQELPH